MLITKSEILKKLKTLKTDEGKYDYLKGLSQKEGILISERESFYELLGGYAIKMGRLASAEGAFEKVGKKLSKEQYIEVGDEIMKDVMGSRDIAEEAYEKAGYAKGLIKVGDERIKVYDDLDKAERAYKKAGYEKGLAKIKKMQKK